MKRFLPYGRQDVGGEEIRRVRDVLESDWLTQGPCVPEFESALATGCGAAHAAPSLGRRGHVVGVWNDGEN